MMEMTTMMMMMMEVIETETERGREYQVYDPQVNSQNLSRITYRSAKRTNKNSKIVMDVHDAEWWNK